MKKHLIAKISAVLLAAGMVVSFAGCGSDDVSSIDPASVMTQVSENMRNYQDISATVAVNLDMKNTQASSSAQDAMQMNASIDLDLKRDPFQMHMAAAAEVTGEDRTQAELYLVPDDSDYLLYAGQTNASQTMEWEKQKIDADEVQELKDAMEASKANAQENEMTEKLAALISSGMEYQVIGRETLEGANVLHIIGNLKLSDVLDAIESSGMEDLIEGYSEIPEQAKYLFQNITVNMQYYVNEETMQLVRCTVDFKDTIDQILDQIINLAQAAYQTDGSQQITKDMIPIQVNAAEVSITIHSMNDAVASITVPQDVQNNAKQVNDTTVDYENYLPFLTQQSNV